MDVRDELEALRERHAHELGSIAWTSEVDRFTELVFCLLNAKEDDPPRVRTLVEVLARVGLDDPATLADATEPTSRAGATLRFVLAQYGIPADAVEDRAAILARLGTVVTSSFEGGIQRFLRRHAEAMRDELAALLTDAGHQVHDETRRAVTHWLQNAASMPLSVNDDAVEAFCRERGLTVADLQEAADAVGLNVAVVDDVIRLEAAVEGVER